MNRADIRNLVIDHTGRSDKASLINSMITAALKKVSSESLWRDLLVESTVTLIPDQNFIQLEPALRRLIEVRIIDGLNSYKLEIRLKSWLVERWPDLTSMFSNRPRYGYLEVKKLFLVPPSSTDWTLKYSYVKRAADLTDDITELIPDIWDEAIIAYATFRTFKSLQMHEDAIQWFADYREAVKDAKQMDKSSAVESKATIRGGGSPIQANYDLNPFIRQVP